MNEGTKKSLIEKSSIDFLDPYFSLIGAQPQLLADRFLDFDDSEIF